MEVSQSDCIKIYLISNPEDSEVERTALRQEVFPRLREYCRHTLRPDIKVIDPYESSNRNHWPDQNLRLQLIQRCRDNNTGPFLLALVGPQYGSASLPGCVEVAQFHMFLEVLQKAGFRTQELERRYVRDENAVPPSYCLQQPITTQLTSYCLQQPITTQDKDQEVIDVFLTAVSQCVHEGLMTSERAQRFYRSALDVELRFALETRPPGDIITLEDRPPDDIITRCLVYVHKITNEKGQAEGEGLKPPNQKREKIAGKATEQPGDLDDLMSQLCDHFLPGVVTSCRRRALVYTTATACCDGRHGYTAARRRSYAQALCQQAYSDLLRLVDGVAPSTNRHAVSRLDDVIAAERGEQEELCRLLSHLYDITRPEEQQIKAYVQQKEQHCPLVVTGGPCSGKTVLLSHCAQQVRAWLGGDTYPVVFPYFLNMSINPSPRHLLSSLCYHIAQAYTPPLTSDLTTSDPEYLNPDLSVSDLTEHLLLLLRLLPSSTRPIVLILDGMDQLTDSGLHMVSCLPSPIPPHVRLILAVSSRRTRLLHAIQLHYPQCNSSSSTSPGTSEGCEESRGLVSMEMGCLDRKQEVRMLAAMLLRSGRTVSSGQQALINQAVMSFPVPLYTRLLHAHAKLWSSAVEVTPSYLPEGVHDSISGLLDHLEQRHGSSLVSLCVSYISLSRTGLTEAELTDLLCYTPPPSGPPRDPQGDTPPSGARDPHGDTPSSGARDPQGDSPSSGARDPQGDTPPSGTRDPQGDTPSSGTRDPQGDTPPSEARDPQGDTPSSGARDPQGDTPPSGATMDQELLSKFPPYGSGVPEVAVELLLQDLQEVFLLRRTVLGVRVFFWVNSHFILVLRRRYLSVPEARRHIHSNMADYFSSRWKPPPLAAAPQWAGQATPTDADEKRRPFFFTSVDPSSTSSPVDLRKFLELPYHLRESNRWEELLSGLMLSLEFHEAMLRAGLLNDLLAMLEEGGGEEWEEGFPRRSVPRERALLAGVLRTSACLLQRNPLELSVVMESRLLPYLSVCPHLSVCPALDAYVTQVVQSRRRRRGEGRMGVALCPAPSTVPSVQRLVHHGARREGLLRAEAGTQCGEGLVRAEAGTQCGEGLVKAVVGTQCGECLVKAVVGTECGSVVGVRSGGSTECGSVVGVRSGGSTECGSVVGVRRDGSAWLWNGPCGEVEELSLRRQENKLTLTSVKSSGRFVLLSADGGKLFLWDVTGGLQTFQEVKDSLTTEASESESDGRTLNTVEGFVVRRDKLCVWWSDRSAVSMCDGLDEPLTHVRCQSSVTSVACSSDGRWAYCGQENGTVSVFDTDSRTLVGSCSNPNRTAITSVFLREEEEEGGVMVCVDVTGNITVWNVATRSPGLVTECLTQSPGLVTECLTQSPGLVTECLTQSPGLVTECLTQSTGLVTECLSERSGTRRRSSMVLKVDFSEETSTLLVCEDHRVVLWDASEWELWESFSAPGGRAFSQALLARDGLLFLASLSSCPLVLVWSIGSGRCVLSLDTGSSDVRPPLALLKTDSHVVSVSRDGGGGRRRLAMWDSELIEAAGAAPKMASAVREMAVERKTGGRFYVTDGSDAVWAWRWRATAPHAHFLHDGPVAKLRLSPDGRRLVTLAGRDIYVWQLEMGSNLLRIAGSRASDVLITPNSLFGVSLCGETGVSGCETSVSRCEAGLSRVWKLLNGSVVCHIHLQLVDAQVSPESTYLIGLQGSDLLAVGLWSGSVSKRFSCAAEASSDRTAEASSERPVVVAFSTLAEHPDFVLVLTASGALYTWKVAEETVCVQFRLPAASSFPRPPDVFQASSDGSFTLLLSSTGDDVISLLDLSRGRLCSVRADGPISLARLDDTGRYAVYVSTPSDGGGCVCSLHAAPVLTAVRLADGKRVGRVRLCKNPSTLLVLCVCARARRPCVFVGFQDGSVGVYFVSDCVRSEGEEEGPVEEGWDVIGQEKTLPSCDRRLPLAIPNVTWPQAAVMM